jgi:adenosylcobinamide hydrolase
LTQSLPPFHVPEISLRREEASDLYARVWRLPFSMLAISSGPLGGGIGTRDWVLNAQVVRTYTRHDPDAHLVELAAACQLSGPGVGMLTAIDVRNASVACRNGVTVDATVGVKLPQWAAAEEDQPAVDAFRGGTVNIVVFLPERLGDSALVNAIGTVTEAKVQAFGDAGIAGTGTASDAVCIVCPAQGEPHAFAGPRSTWGAPLARAVHAAVLSGCREAEST